MRDLTWNEEVQKKQMYDRLSKELKETMVLKDRANSSLNAYMILCKNIHNRIRALVEEKKSRFPLTTCA